MRMHRLNGLNRLLLFVFLVALCGGLAAQPGSGKPPQEAPKLPEGAAALVNGEVISLQAVYDALFRQYGQGVLDQMIKAKLAEQEAKRQGIQLDTKEVEKKVNEWKTQFLSRFNNDEKAADDMLKRQGSSLAATLDYMRNHHSTETLWAQLVRQKKKPDWKSLKEVFEQRYGSDGEKLDVAHIVLTTNVNDARYQDRYSEREHYRRIDQVEKEAAALAATVADRARAAEDFAKLARECSDDWSKQNGGQLGEFWKNRFGKEFEATVEKGNMGDIIGPVPVKEGVLVAKIEPAEFDTTFSARHIFLVFKKGNRDQVLARAEKLKQELDKGADFAELAAKVSEDPLTKDNGGLWEPFKAKERVPQISNALERLEPGQITDPIATRFGVHIIKLEKRDRTPKGDKKGVSIVLVSTQYQQVREKHLKPIIEKEARARADEIIKKLQAGADFGEMARKNSDEKFTGERGGHINGYNKNRISPEFHAFVMMLEPGTVAPEPILTNQGYHVVKLINREKTSFDKVKNELFQEEKDKPPSPMEMQRLQEMLRNTAEVVKRQ